ncbi:MAG TPA: thioesterase domain-containing protein [Anaerolineae bacterium]|nr:thioesterase domain-containing protein [Anaerolineae bacterium]
MDNKYVTQNTLSSNGWVIRPQPTSSARVRLFCFPYAGGGASAYYPWVNNVPQGVEVCPIQFPGRQGRREESPFDRMAPLLNALAPAIRPYLDMPYVFFGHSLGAKISFELARHLREQGDPMPVHLFFSGSNAPNIASASPPLHALPEAEFVETLRHFKGTPEALLQNAALLQLFLPVLRADITLHETYRYVPGEPFDCPIAVFGGQEDDEVTRENLAAWHSQTQGTFILRMFPGDHFFLRSAQTALLQALSHDLLALIG